MKKLLLALTLLTCLLLAGCDADLEGLLSRMDGEATKAPAATDAAAEPTAAPAQAYLIVTAAGAVYEPIPLYEAGRYTITRGDHVNVIEVTTDSVKMAESSCDNQDCVYQGTVSLENRSSRVLQNMILCLPNEVMLELYTYEEMLEVLAGWEAQAQ